VLVDAGVETYRKQTFSAQRYEIWTMRSVYHTLLPAFGRPEDVGAHWRETVEQAAGRDYAASDILYHCDEGGAQLSFDLSGAYPATAGVLHWLRTVELLRGDAVTVKDRYQMREAPSVITLSVLTPCEVELSDGQVVFKETAFGPPEASRTSGSARLIADAPLSRIEIERVAIDDDRLSAVWGNYLNRVIFTIWSPPMEGTWVWCIRPL
jgi:hypothetical protein